MKGFIKNSLVFIGGAAIGCGATYLYLIKKIQKDMDEIREYYEIKSKEFEDRVKDAYTIEKSSLDELDTPEKISADMAKHKPDLSEIETVISIAEGQKDTSKVRYDKAYEENEEVDDIEDSDEQEDLEPEDLADETVSEEVDTIDTPYSIEVEEYDSNESFDKVGYALYPNGRFYNEDEVEIDEETVIKDIGSEMLDYFKESNDKNLYVRNEVNRTDYELVKIYNLSGHPQKG